jgi:hypothetical protein
MEAVLRRKMADLSSCFDVPAPESRVGRGRGSQYRAVGRERQGFDAGLVRVPPAHLARGRQIPEYDLLPAAEGQSLAVGREGQAPDLVLLPHQHPQQPARPSIPQPNRLVRTAGSKRLAVWGKGDGQDRAGVAQAAGPETGDGPGRQWVGVPIRVRGVISPRRRFVPVRLGAPGRERGGDKANCHDGQKAGGEHAKPLRECCHLLQRLCKMTE